ncbi:flagellar basal body protein [Polaromonas sp. A23]|uniref:flagellar basal body rod protein FlgB n=1 Tax=Polaromonas sp. A23 TaxID=1944133 RepID=UPI0009D16683|nr:flagellar basal body protein [Polaromonas sp. A23]OOG44445.1 hypothetical protein B0B52_06795 [Polaromonas sp. A23]
MADSLFGSGFALARVALDAATMRHETIAANIANINTEGYTPLKVGFEEYLDRADIARADWSLSRNAVTPVVEPDLSTASISPQVALSTEIVKLNANTIQYQVLVKAMSRAASVLQIAISEGK